jgi:organic hydroperoxide reductase OsmC/OhrA
MQYTANLVWKGNGTPFTVKTYDRTHAISFGSGQNITGSSAPEFLGNKELANPEELYTASISSCLMLTFLYWAAMKGLVIEEYSAEAVGTLGKNDEGKMCMTEVVIKPKLTFGGNNHPDPALLKELFHKAHENCFISSSIKTNVKIDI